MLGDSLPTLVDDYDDEESKAAARRMVRQTRLAGAGVSSIGDAKVKPAVAAREPSGAVASAMKMGGASGETPSELLRRVAEVERQFPPGLQARRYSMEELIAPIGPGRGFASEGSRQTTIMNPITGGRTNIAEGTDPRMYLAGINMLAEAKAKAVAAAIRGFKADEASRDNLARGFGLDPAAFGGMNDDDARISIKAAYAKKEGLEEEGRKRGEGESERAAMISALRERFPDIDIPVSTPRSMIAQMFSTAFAQREDQAGEARKAEREQAAETKVINAGTAQQRLEEIALERGASAALQQVEELTRGYMTVPQTMQLKNHYAARAKDEAARNAADQAATARSQQQSKAARDRAVREATSKFESSFEEPLQKALMFAPTKRVKREGLRGEEIEVDEPDALKSSEQLRGSIQAAVTGLWRAGLKVTSANAAEAGLSKDAANTLENIEMGNESAVEELRALAMELLSIQPRVLKHIRASVEAEPVE